MRGRVLIVAGSDSGGGAGIQADIKTVTALDGFAATAITALTAQNTQGVFGLFPVAPNFIVQQMDVVLSDIGTDAVKTGMLHNADVVSAVAEFLRGRCADIPVVVDPVMVAQSGDPLLRDDAVAAIVERLVPQAAVLTPNVPEAERLAAMTVRTPDDMRRAGEALRAKGAAAVLVKGGHLEGERVIEVLVMADRIETFEDARIVTRHTHGTGCTLASAIATGLAQGLGLVDAVARARAYLREALRTAPGLGHGSGPVNHAHTVRPFPG
jgi:hydroxymethylpyrimidine/phosphomethylpyrimidine kinase